MLEWVRSTLGVGKITRKQPTSIQHAPGFTFCIANRQALSLLAQVEPYLRSYKARRARLALERYLRLTPRNGKYTASLLADRHDFEREFSAISIRMSQSKSRHALLAMPAEGS